MLCIRHDWGEHQGGLGESISYGLQYRVPISNELTINPVNPGQWAFKNPKCLRTPSRGYELFDHNPLHPALPGKSGRIAPIMSLALS